MSHSVLNLIFFLKETISVVKALVYASGFTYFKLIIVNKITPVRVSKEDAGVDGDILGKTAYL